MDSFIFAVNATLPIVLMVLLGYFIKRVGLVDKSATKTINSIVFRVLLPVNLFLNIYNIETLGGINLNYVWYVLGITIALFLIFIPIVNLVFSKRNQRGVILQSIFRSNYALIGIPLATSLFDAAGAATASLLAAFIVPVFNILGVICLCIYSDEGKPDIKNILLNIAKNPLILGVLTGIVTVAIRSLFAELGIDFRLSEVTPLFKTLNYISVAATPMALLALGAQFEFSAIPNMKKQIIFGVSLRCLLVPTVSLTVAYLIGAFSGSNFAAFVAMFATPVAVSTVPMCQSMGADHELAGQLVVWSTIISAGVIFLSSFILKSLGVF